MAETKEDDNENNNRQTARMYRLQPVSIRARFVVLVEREAEEQRMCGAANSKQRWANRKSESAHDDSRHSPSSVSD